MQRNKSLSLFALLLTTMSFVAACSAKKENKGFQGGGTQNASEEGNTGTPTPTQPTILQGDTRVSDIAYLDRGPVMLETRLWMLNQAKHSVRLQAFLFDGDEVGSYMADRLIEMHKRGIRVEIAIDFVANINLKAQILLGRIAQSGIPIEGFEPAYLQFLDALATASTLEDAGKDYNFRFHDKMFIIDGEDANGMAIVGGANMGNPYFYYDGGDPKQKWQDQDVIVRGPIVADITAVFDNNMKNMRQNATGEGTSSLAKILNSLSKTLDLSAPLQKLLKLRPAVMAQVKQADGKTPTLAWHQGALRFTQSRPREKEDKILPEYLDLIAKAQNTITISNSYFIPTDRLQKALIDAAQRGVQVRILTNSPDTGDIPQVQLAGRTLYYDLLIAANKNAKGSLKIYEWKGDKTFKNGFTLHHAKCMAIDSHAGIVGSFNLDPRSEMLNSETVMVFEEENLAKAFENNFAIDSGAGFGQEVTINDAWSWKQPNDMLEALQSKLLVGFKPYL